MSQVLKYFAVFVLWNLAASLPLLFLHAMAGRARTPLLLAALLWAVLVTAALLRFYLLRPLHVAPERRWATLRLRPLRGGTLRWTLVAAPVLLALAWALGEVYVRLIPVPPEKFNPFQELTGTALGRLSLAVLAVGVAPVMEEFFFRGLIQRSLERRWGARRGIVGAAALFTLVHLQPWVVPLHFFLGLAFGFTVYATRSIWSGVVLHAINNSVALAGLLMRGDHPSPSPTLWEIGVTLSWWASLAALAVTALLAAWTARRLWEAGRGMRLRFG